MSGLSFSTSAQLDALVEAYFVYIKGVYRLEDTVAPGDNEEDIISKKIWNRVPEHATFSGLAYFLGFNSRKEFEEYAQSGSFAPELARAQLRVDMVYEKQLHNQSSTGAIFALRSRGWNEKETIKIGQGSDTLNVNIIETGPKPAGNEQEVVL